MRRSNLIILLVGCGVIALTPLFTWAAGRYLSFVDDRWTETLSTIGVTMPVGLALAALVLVLHGLWMNRWIAAELHEAYEYDHEGEYEMAAAPAGTRTATRQEYDDEDGGRGGSGSTGAKSSKSSTASGKAKKKAARKAKSSGRRVTQRGKGMARREMRKHVPRF